MTELRRYWFVLLLSVCGLSACGAASTHAVAPAGALSISRAPWSITFANDSVLALSAEGVLAIGDRTLGTIELDGRLLRDGQVFATLAPDGAMTIEGEELAPRIAGSRMVEHDVAVLEIDDASDMHVRAPDGREIASFAVEGAAPDANPTILFLTAVYLIEAARSHADEHEAAAEVADDESEEDDDLWRMPIDDAPSEGPADALVTIVELTDFQCPYCSRGAAAMTAIRQRFPDDVRLVVRQRPLPFHENARPAAEAALEARAQLGDAAFFRMAALLFANQRTLTRSTLESLATLVGLDLPRLRRALDDGAHEDAIARDEALGDQMGAEGTPTFYVNGELIVGAQRLESFVHAVERARARAQAALDRGVPRDQLYSVMLANARDGSASAEQAIPPAPDVHFVDVAAPVGAPAIGPARARTTVQVFLDLSSSHATEARALIERLSADPLHAARIVLRLTPRDSTSASEAVFAVTAASSPELGFRYAMELASTPSDLSATHLAEVATRIAHVSLASSGHPFRDRVEADRQAMQGAAIAGSPVVFVAGRHVLWGVPNYDALTTAVDAAAANPDEGHPAAPSDVAHAPSGAQSVEGGAAWITEHAGEGSGAQSALLARIASWDANGLTFDGTAAAPLRVRLDGLDAPLAAALRGIRPGETRRVWLPGSRVVYVEAVDVE